MAGTKNSITATPDTSTTGGISLQGAAQNRMRPFLGFQRAYKFYLWLTLGGILLVLSLFRMRLIDTEYMRRNVAPGELFWFNQRFYQLSLKLHLATVLPASCLSVFQFLPLLRTRYPQVHRICGRCIFSMFYIGAFSGLLITRHALGGSISAQTASGTLSILLSVSIYKSWTAIRRKQVTEHRAWALRVMAYMSSVVTTGAILISMAFAVDKIGGHWTIFSCDEIEFAFTDNPFSPSNRTLASLQFANKYPTCASSSVAPVKASFGSEEEVASALRLVFGAAMWMAIIIHGVVAEYYLNLTDQRTKNSGTVLIQTPLDEHSIKQE